MATEEFTVSDLTDEERHVLARGLAEWGGPARCTDALAAAMDFASDVFGSGWDWSITTGLADEDTIRILRSLQRKIARAVKIHEP